MKRPAKSPFRLALLALTAWVSVSSVCALETVTAADEVPPSAAASTAAAIRSLSDGLAELTFDAPTPLGEAWLAYRRYYGFSIGDDVSFHAGTVSSGTYRVAVQVFGPANPVATVVAVHGYYDHTGLMRPLIEHLLSRGFTVVSVDLPGHGLSSGARVEIRDFAEYGAAVRDATVACAPYVPSPLFAVGHSTGCAGFIEWYYGGGADVFRKMVFIAPLIRSALWYPSKLGYLIGTGWLTEPRRWYRKSTGDRAYVPFQKNDPLGHDRFPMSWSSALYAWEKRLRGYPAVTVPVLVIQGTADNTVNYRHNIPFLEKKMAARVEYIEGADHLLIQEIPEYSGRLFDLIDAYFMSESSSK